MSPVAPQAGNILSLATGALSFLGLRKADLLAVLRPIVWMTLAGLLLGTTYVFPAGSISGLVGFLALAPLLAIWLLV